MRTRILLTVLVAAALALAAGARTRLYVFLDTEDYTSERANDAIVTMANVLAEEGISAHFDIVGYLAERLIRSDRRDVLEALKPHSVGLQTYRHSFHPNLTELGDLADYDEAYRRIMQEERMAKGMVEAFTGRDGVDSSVQPGSGSSYVGMYVYRDLGITVSGGIMALYSDDPRGMYWYCGQLQVPYYQKFSLEHFMKERTADEEDEKPCLDELAKRDAAILYMHPNKLIFPVYWDALNYDGGNLVKWGEWKVGAERPKAEQEKYLADLRAFLRRVKADGRFEFADIRDLIRAVKPRVAIRRTDLPAIRKSLERRFGEVTEPASWCVAETFLAAVHFLRGNAEPYAPGKSHGFLSAPQGVKAPVRVTRAGLVAAAKAMDTSRFLPARIEVDGVAIGPADFLFAALAVLTDGADAVTVTPRDQLGDIAAVLPDLVNFRHPGTWIYAKDFKDEYLSDRLRWQFWTFRHE